MFGLLLGYWGGTVDLIAQRVVDAVQSFPWLFLVITVMSLLGPGIVQVIIVLGVPWGIVNIRTVRSVVLSVKETPYVEAARATGASTLRILARHIAPQIVAPMIVLFTVSVGGSIIGEASVSFLGFGIPPPQPSWGSMLSIEGRTYMLQAPLLAGAVPGRRGLRDQHVRRRVARPARPPAARRHRPLRRRGPARRPQVTAAATDVLTLLRVRYGRCAGRSRAWLTRAVTRCWLRLTPSSSAALASARCKLFGRRSVTRPLY